MASVRLAPSGSPLGEIEAPSGLLRMTDFRWPLDDVSQDGTDPEAPLLFDGTAVRGGATMPDCVSTNRYYAVFSTLMGQAADSLSFTLRASWSFNGGGSWVDDAPAQGQQFVCSNLAPAGAPMFGVWFATRLRLGSALGDGSMPAMANLTVSCLLLVQVGTIRAVATPAVPEVMTQIFEFGPE